MKLIVALVLTAGLLGITRPAAPRADDHSGICVGGVQIVACVPPDSP